MGFLFTIVLSHSFSGHRVRSVGEGYKPLFAGRKAFSNEQIKGGRMNNVRHA
jgi:hypothetical protein